MRTIRPAAAILVVFLASSASVALLQHTPPAPLQDITVYFSPKGGATDAILKELTAARSEIKVMAYSSPAPRSPGRYDNQREFA